MEELKKAFLLDEGANEELIETTIPILLNRYGENFVISIDGVEWIKTTNQTHAVVLFEMMKDNITEYMNYKAI